MSSLYKPVREARHFSCEQTFHSINWESLPDVITAYKNRIENWYIEPATELAKNWHFAFSVLAINCLLIDSLSQLNNPDSTDVGKRYREFIRFKLKKFNQKVRPAIRYTDERDNVQNADDVADVFYLGVRNGILHEAKCALYSKLERFEGTRETFRIHQTGQTIYNDNKPCTCVAFDPLNLLDELKDVFKQYIADLRNPLPAYNRLRGKFKTVILDRFGEKIPDTL